MYGGRIRKKQLQAAVDRAPWLSTTDTWIRQQRATDQSVCRQVLLVVDRYGAVGRQPTGPHWLSTGISREIGLAQSVDRPLMTVNMQCFWAYPSWTLRLFLIQILSIWFPFLREITAYKKRGIVPIESNLLRERCIVLERFRVSLFERTLRPSAQILNLNLRINLQPL